MKYRNDETDKVNIIESSITGIYFDNENYQIELEVNWSEGLPINIICEDVSNYSIDFENISEYGCDIGDLEIRGWSYIKNKDKWIVQFDFEFNPKGIIKISCSDFYFDVLSEPYSKGGNDNLIQDLLFSDFILSGSGLGELTLHQLKFDSIMWNTNIIFMNKAKRIEILCNECFNHKYKIYGDRNRTLYITEAEINNIMKSFDKHKQIYLVGLSNNSISLNCTKLEIKEKYN